MKPRLDEPHLEKLRHDYQLLHEAYENDRADDGFWDAMLILGWLCLTTAIGAIALTIAGAL